MIPVVERQMRTLTVGIGTLFDGNCGEKSFPEFFVRVRSGFREGKAFYFIWRKTGQIKGPVSGMHDASCRLSSRIISFLREAGQKNGERPGSAHWLSGKYARPGSENRRKYLQNG